MAKRVRFFMRLKQQRARSFNGLAHELVGYELHVEPKRRGLRP